VISLNHIVALFDLTMLCFARKFGCAFEGSDGLSVSGGSVGVDHKRMFECISIKQSELAAFYIYLASSIAREEQADCPIKECVSVSGLDHESPRLPITIRYRRKEQMNHCDICHLPTASKTEVHRPNADR
jgi:hypothetical protein